MPRLFTLLVVALAVGVLLAAPVPKDKEKDEKPGPITDEHLKAAVKNLKQIGLALHNYHDVNGFLPGNTTTKDGKPGLSWRVAILPYLEQDHLYKQFNLDEAWDSDHNKKLVEKMPDLFAPVRVKTKEKGMTFYQGFDGKDAAFETGLKLRLAGGFPDGTANTVGVVEAGEPVVWTKPNDLPFDVKNDLPKLGGLFDGDFHVLFMDGSVQKAIGKKVDARQFKNIVTRNGGEVMLMDYALGQQK